MFKVSEPQAGGSRYETDVAGFRRSRPAGFVIGGRRRAGLAVAFGLLAALVWHFVHGLTEPGEAYLWSHLAFEIGLGLYAAGLAYILLRLAGRGGR